MYVLVYMYACMHVCMLVFSAECTYNRMVVDRKSRSVLPMNEEVWGVVVIVITRRWSTERTNT